MIAFHISGQTLVNQNAGYVRDLGGQFALFFGGLIIWLGLIALPTIWLFVTTPLLQTFPQCFSNVEAMSDGVSDTAMPRSARMRFFAWAVSSAPPTMADPKPGSAPG